ncbi:hypothetical protein QA612_03945 [Evansella sp. AB-P1]|uniref:hypothetical protein n=1 Tax=Evansella sp. AB-P1 TaxID=3037653 RepID=UPI00241C58A2|nr:hypothetical protein [Evansella sp. AB-P1]MDG5786631.1 hypothetical protein [Evansella sp. AB-P1]
MDVIGLEFLKGFGRLWLHPLTYIFFLVVFFIGVRRVKRERKDFHTRVHDVILDIASPMIIGISMGLILSLLLTTAGIEVPVGMMVLLLVLWIVFLPFRQIRWLSMAFIGSIALLVSPFLPNGGTNFPLINQWLQDIQGMNAVGFAWILVALFLAEAFLILINGWKHSSPKLISSKRGKTVGSHEVKRLWPVPILLLFPIGSLVFDGWWPLFQSANSLENGLMIIPFILGFQLTVQSQHPEEGIKKVGKQLLILSVVLVFVAGAATYLTFIVPAVAIIGLLGRELIFILFHASEKHKTGYFTNRESGLTILGILPQSTAEKMELEIGEVILKVNGYEVYSQRDFYEALQVNSAYCKLEIIDLSGEVRFAQSSIHENEHYQIGLLFVPDGENGNLSARGLRSSVVIYNDRNGKSLTMEKKFIEDEKVVTNGNEEVQTDDQLYDVEESDVKEEETDSFEENNEVQAEEVETSKEDSSFMDESDFRHTSSNDYDASEEYDKSEIEAAATEDLVERAVKAVQEDEEYLKNEDDQPFENSIDKEVVDLEREAHPEENFELDLEEEIEEKTDESYNSDEESAYAKGTDKGLEEVEQTDLEESPDDIPQTEYRDHTENIAETDQHLKQTEEKGKSNESFITPQFNEEEESELQYGLMDEEIKGEPFDQKTSDDKLEKVKKEEFENKNDDVEAEKVHAEHKEISSKALNIFSNEKKEAEEDKEQSLIEAKERRAETGEKPYGQAAGLSAFYEEFRETVPKREKKWLLKGDKSNEKEETDRKKKKRKF